MMNRSILSAIRLPIIGAVALPLLFCSLPTWADTPWKNLNRKQQELLATLKPQWNEMSGSQQDRWALVSRKYESASPETQEKMRNRISTWANMSPSEKEAARENYRALKTYNRGERNSSWNSYQVLEEQEKILYKESQTQKRQQSGVNPFVPAGAAAYNR